MEVKDANGNILNEGDSVSITQDLKVKNASNIKRGTKIKNIRLVEDDPDNIEGKVNGTMMVIKTCYLKKLK